MGIRILTGVLASALAALPAVAQDAYVVGLTGALTGPPSSTYAPAVEALRIYIERVNAAGGVNGKQIRLVIQDDSAEPSRAAANVKKLTTQDNAVLLINATLSTTYAPVVAEAKRANVPLLFASGVCPKEVYPPADPLAVLHHRLCGELRQPRDARLHQGHRKAAGDASASPPWRSRCRAPRWTTPRARPPAPA